MEKEQLYLYELEESYDMLAKECACGMRSVMARLENLLQEMNDSSERSPFESITHRIKTFDSAVEKCHRKGWDVSVETFQKMHDIAGIRIIVPFLDDVYTVRDAVVRQRTMTVVEERDYIKSPKKNGYRSYHLIVKMHTIFMHSEKDIPVEIQIRTKAEDFWSSMEHKLRYKNQDPSPEAAKEFAEFAEELYQKEMKMMNLRDHNKIDSFINDDFDEENDEDDDIDENANGANI